MGSCKQLLPLDGTAAVVRCIEALLQGGIAEPVVMVSPDGDAVAAAVAAYPVRVVRTSDPAGEMTDTVRAGLEELPPDTTGVMIALCDHPLVSPATIARLAGTAQREPASIVIPVYEGRRGHPVVFPRSILDELDGDLTLRDLVRSDPDRVLQVEVADPGVLLEMDTPADYRRLTGLCAGTR